MYINYLKYSGYFNLKKSKQVIMEVKQLKPSKVYIPVGENEPNENSGNYFSITKGNQFAILAKERTDIYPLTRSELEEIIKDVIKSAKQGFIGYSFNDEEAEYKFLNSEDEIIKSILP